LSPTNDVWIGLEIAEGRYKILGRIGQGSMGRVYLASDRHLKNDVVIKFPFAANEASADSDFLGRFAREVKSLVHLSHPHIVKVFDIGEQAGHPFVVMEFLAGGSLKDRLTSGPDAAIVSMPAPSLGDWLPEIAKALDFVHSQRHIHRDVKPANILFDRHGNAFLGDFGIIKGLAAEDADWRCNSLTAPGFLVGTPNYVAPEIVMGQPFDGRVDQYSLAMTVHEVLSGTNCMEGPTPSATVVNQTMVVPPALTDLIPGIPGRLSDAILKGLAKNPAQRFENCVSLAQEIMRAIPSRDAASGATLPDEPEPDPSAATIIAERPMSFFASGPDKRRGSYKTMAMIGLTTLVVFSLLTLIMVIARRGASGLSAREQEGNARSAAAQAQISVQERQSLIPPSTDADPVEINVAFGTEKQHWLEEATAEFQKSPTGRGIKVNLHGMGSMEAARAVIEGPTPIPIQVWSPASGAYRDAFEREWRTTHANLPIIKVENLALTPMVFVTWESRHQPFLKKFSKLTFQTVASAIGEPGGWGTIAGQPDWGRFKFGHTHPNRSNSGLLTLVLMAYEFFKKDRNLSAVDLNQLAFQQWLRAFELGVARPGGPLTPSTGTLMREMVLRGPSQYDCVIIYENLAIEYLEAARDRWGELRVDYPEPNIWNEHPFYILDVPWSNSRQRAAAGEFLKFLMSEPIQKHALKHGFRPGNPDVSVRFPQSPLLRLAKHGLRIDLPRMCEPPNDDILQKLLILFRRIEE
jgi:serine/threonine protein kinase